jgi:Protein of unknown function (DUF3037)
MSRYVYSLVRCVPDPQTGEFVNIGAIAGDPAAGDWSVRQVSNESRVRKLAGAVELDAVHRFLTEVGLLIDDTRAAMEEDATVSPLGHTWLQSLYEDHQNVVQLSPPAPVVADDAEQALDFLFARKVIDPLMQTREKIVTKWRVVSELREAYRRADVDDRLVQQRAELFVGAHVHTMLDFAIVADKAVQLTQGWSFRRAQVDQVSEQVKAWAYAIQLLRGREEARVVSTREQVSEISPDVALEVVVAPPKSAEQRRAYEEADQVFEQLGAVVRNLDDVDTVGRQAAELLAKSRR